MTENAIKEEKPFFVRYNKLMIDDIVYMFDYETNTVTKCKTTERYSKVKIGRRQSTKM